MIAAGVFEYQGNSIKIAKATKLENAYFNNIFKQVVNRGKVDVDKDIYIYNKFFGFSFDPEMTLKRFNFIFGTKDKAVSFQLLYDSGAVHMRKNTYGNPETKINLKLFLDTFDNIDYNLVLKSLAKGDRYSVNMYPENNLSNAGYIYNKSDLFTKELYLYSKDGLSKVAGNTISFNEETLLFSIQSMQKTKKDPDGESFNSIDSVFLIVPMKFVTDS